MSHTICLDGVQCPECGEDETFELEVRAKFAVSYVDVGSKQRFFSFRPPLSMGWDGDSTIRCFTCGHSATVADFTATVKRDNPEERQETQQHTKRERRAEMAEFELGGEMDIVDRSQEKRTRSLADVEDALEKAVALSREAKGASGKIAERLHGATGTGPNHEDEEKPVNSSVVERLYANIHKLTANTEMLVHDLETIARRVGGVSNDAYEDHGDRERMIDGT